MIILRRIMRIIILNRIIRFIIFIIIEGYVRKDFVKQKHNQLFSVITKSQAIGKWSMTLEVLLNGAYLFKVVSFASTSTTTVEWDAWDHLKQQRSRRNKKLMNHFNIFFFFFISFKFINSFPRHPGGTVHKRVGFLF